MMASTNPIVVPAGKKVSVQMTPLGPLQPLASRCQGVCGAEATPYLASDFLAGIIEPKAMVSTANPSQAELLALEVQLRNAALAQNDFYLLGLNAVPAIETASGLDPFPLPGSAVGGAGIYQLLSFPISRFNGIPLPMESSIRFADPARWLGKGMESRLFTISVDGTNKFFSWDAHFPVGNKPHAYYHVNQKGMFSVMGEADHAALTGTALVQAKQLRYLKIGGRIFLVVGVVIDTVQLGVAGYESYKQGSAKPIGKQAVRTATGWAAAWAGAKAGVAAGALVGVETGPGVVLTAIGGGLIGGAAGYFGGNWIADWLFDD